MAKHAIIAKLTEPTSFHGNFTTLRSNMDIVLSFFEVMIMVRFSLARLRGSILFHLSQLASEPLDLGGEAKQ
jgi:hypothetical protein